MSGRSDLNTLLLTATLRTANTLTTGAHIATAASSAELYTYEIPGTNAADKVQYRLRGRVVMTGVTISSGATYYLLFYGSLINRLTRVMETNVVFWHSSFVAGSSLTGDLLAIGYPNNIVYEV
jgi:hypothetical protein